MLMIAMGKFEMASANNAHNKYNTDDKTIQRDRNHQSIGFHKILHYFADWYLNIDIPSSFYLYRKSNHKWVVDKHDGTCLEWFDMKWKLDQFRLMVVSLLFFYWDHYSKEWYYTEEVKLYVIIVLCIRAWTFVCSICCSPNISTKRKCLKMWHYKNVIAISLFECIWSIRTT